MSGRGSSGVRVLVLAGGTGTGKSTLSRHLAQLGAELIDADRVGHQMLLEPSVRERVVEEFGPEILGEDGEIDRGRLGPLVFADEGRRRALNALVHPALVAEIGRRIDHLRSTGAVDLVVVDAALWFEFEATAEVELPEVDLVVMTTAPESERLRRIMARDGVDAVAARARIRAQKAIEASHHRADAVLDTRGERSRVRAELVALLDARLGLDLADDDPRA